MNENNTPNDQWPPQNQPQNQQQPAPQDANPHAAPPYGTPPHTTMPPYGAPPAYGMPLYGEDTSVMTTKDWIITYLILLIPCVNFIMPFVWAFGTGNVNRRNWARAYLIVLAISITLVIIFWAIFAAVISTTITDPVFIDMWNW